MEKTTRSTAKNILIGVLILFSAATFTLAYYQHMEKMEYADRITDLQGESDQKIFEIYQRIDKNLAEIREHEGLIKNTIDTRKREGSFDPEERINKQISFIERIMQQNRDLITSLNTDLNIKDDKVKEYVRMQKNLWVRINEYKDVVNSLTRQNGILEQDLEMSEFEKLALEIELEKLDTEIEQKVVLIQEKNEQIYRREKEMNTAYYAVGTYRQLREKEIVHRAGGFLGIAAVTTMTNEFDQALLFEIDTRTVREIPIWARKAEIVTSQDPASYTFETYNGIIERIRIDDPEKFWEKSKHLVVIVRDTYESELAEAWQE
ncbi:MAG: hypothetical protein U5Q03_10375 [Bacteroidota bacterium]|nr:hypothetical protein [Bacteroidota bacterium]